MPSLLHRLKVHGAGDEAQSRAISREEFRQTVVADLEDLFNCTCPVSNEQLLAYPAIRQSVIAFGLPAVAGGTASSLDIPKFEQRIVDMLRAFEPRLDPASIQVKAEVDEGVLSLHNIIGLKISGMLWFQPWPIELLLRTEIDLETGSTSIACLN